MSIANDTITVNGNPVAIKPNSFKYKRGVPKSKVRTVVVGNTRTQDFSQDFEDSMGSVSFVLLPSVENEGLIDGWQDALNTNTVTDTGIETISGVEQSFRRTFKNASVVDDPERAHGADGEIPIEFKCDQAV